ncbi:hypothetical protein MTYM_00547 [Methylococcales bacterium]|nr:hypothetical protein MTYM_00547 [Methylococcales bacterium]
MSMTGWTAQPVMFSVIGVRHIVRGHHLHFFRGGFSDAFNSALTLNPTHFGGELQFQALQSTLLVWALNSDSLNLVALHCKNPL